MQEIAKNIVAWFRKQKRDLPWRNNPSPYRVWLSEVILQQTRVAQGIPYYLRFAESYPEIHDLAAATEEDILKLWQGLGYYSRARNMLKTARLVVEQYGGKLPETPSELMQLPGLGAYTAAAVASIAYGYPEPVLDGNVLRVVSRLRNDHALVDKPETRKRFREWLLPFMHQETPALVNQALMELGALVCLPSKPLCSDCPLAVFCAAKAAGTAGDLPRKTPKPAVQKRYFHYLHIDDGSRLYLVKRQAGDIWQGLYEFPMHETEKADAGPEIWLSENFTDPDEVRIRGSQKFTHLLTHRRLEAVFWKLSTPPENLRCQAPIFEFPLKKDTWPAMHRLMEKYLERNVLTQQHDQ
jgi:A/G-specific adenine glycosylase